MQGGDQTSHLVKIPHSLEASFDFNTFVCNLFRSDVNAFFQDEKNDSNYESIKWLIPSSALTIFKICGSDFVSLKNLPIDLSSDTKAKLFHEWVHYLQIISSPLQQLSFIYFLEKLRSEIAKLGGSPKPICSQLFEDDIASDEEIEKALASAEANFIFRGEVTNKMIVGPNVISVDPFTDMPLLELPHPEGNNIFLPAYGAVLGFGSHHKTVVVPFTGCHLLESAAYISQLLFEKKKLPRPENLDEDQDKIYLGPWEFWRRLHGPYYDREEDLALAFLVAVDLTMIPNIIDAPSMDPESRLEMASVPYRFGKLAYRAQGYPPIKFSEDNPRKDVAKFQEEFCRWCGWPTPREALLNMAVFLTRILIGAYAYVIPATKENKELLSWLINCSTKEVAECVERLDCIWKLMSNACEIASPRIGQDILGVMLNACMYRIQHPGEMALPHIYMSSLRMQFPLPIIFLGGEYYLDVDAHALECGWPYPINSLRMLNDCIGLVALKPLQRGIIKCGFLQEEIDCLYLNAGFGCPQRNLTEEQEGIRCGTELEDWCHWTHRAVQVGIASKDTINRWKARIMKTSVDLTGVWECDDGGIYYIRQLDNKIWWYGENNSNNPYFSNVAAGTISGHTISLEWADVPKGATMNSGTLVLIVSKFYDKISAIKKTEEFGGSLWTR